VSVTHRYCIKTAKANLKLFRPPGSPIILVSSDPYADMQFQGELFSGGVKYTGVGKIGNFRRKSPFISETDGRWLLWNVNRKLWVPDRLVSYSMTLSDPNLSFKVTVYLQVEYLKNSSF